MVSLIGYHIKVKLWDKEDPKLNMGCLLSKEEI